MSEKDSILKANQNLPDRSRPRQKATWDEIGDTFETMGKIGLAMAVGMSAAGLFCRLAEQGKVRVPTLSSLVLNGREENRREKEKGD